MQYSATTPSDYIAQLDEDWRRPTLLAIRAIIQTHAPELTEDIHHKMLGYADGDTHVFHLNAQKGYVSLYVGNAAKIDPTGEMLAGLNVGKGCIRFSKTKTVEGSQIDAFIARAIEIWRSGEDIAC